MIKSYIDFIALIRAHEYGLPEARCPCSRTEAAILCKATRLQPQMTGRAMTSCFRRSPPSTSSMEWRRQRTPPRTNVRRLALKPKRNSLVHVRRFSSCFSSAGSRKWRFLLGILANSLELLFPIGDSSKKSPSRTNNEPN